MTSLKKQRKILKNNIKMEKDMVNKGKTYTNLRTGDVFQPSHYKKAMKQDKKDLRNVNKKIALKTLKSAAKKVAKGALYEVNNLRKGAEAISNGLSRTKKKNDLKNARQAVAKAAGSIGTGAVSNIARKSPSSRGTGLAGSPNGRNAKPNWKSANTYTPKTRKTYSSLSRVASSTASEAASESLSGGVKSLRKTKRKPTSNRQRITPTRQGLINYKNR